MPRFIVKQLNKMKGEIIISLIFGIWILAICLIASISPIDWYNVGEEYLYITKQQEVKKIQVVWKDKTCLYMQWWDELYRLCSEFKKYIIPLNNIQALSWYEDVVYSNLYLPNPK